MPEPTDTSESPSPVHTEDHTEPANRVTRRRMIGALIRAARERSGRKARDLADFVGISTAALTAIENGEKDCSLPQLEAIAYDLQLPIHALLGQDAATTVERSPVSDIESILRLRGYMIGARLRQARLNRGESVQQTAAAAGLQPAALQSYELGKRQPGLVELETLMDHFGLTLDDMLDIGVGPLGQAQLLQQQRARFDAMSAELRQFLCEPASMPSLLAAMRLREMRPEQLRAIADAFIALIDEAEENRT